MKKFTSVIATCCILLGVAGPAAAKMNLKFGIIAPPTHPEVKSMEAFAAYVKDKTKGEITIDLFPLGQLGSERSMVEQVQSGTLDMMDCTTAVLSNFVPQVSLFDLPFLWPSREVAYKVLGDANFFKIYEDIFPEKGMKFLGYGENEMRDLTNTKREVRKPEDVKGMKIRVIEAPVFLETWRLLGASPVPMPFPEVYNALQQGVIDAQENPILTSALMKFTEVCPYVTITNYSLTETIRLMNIDLWNRLTPEQQQIFREASELATKLNRESGMKMTAEITAKLEAEGKVKIVHLSKEERDLWHQAVQPVHAKFEKEVGNIPNKPEFGRFAGMSYLQLFQEKIKQYQ